MHLTNAANSSARIARLERLRARGTTISHYDPDGQIYGMPTYPWRWAPRGLYTVRQLRERGLRPGGQDIAAQILWRHGNRVAYLYREDLALPKRQATPAQLASIERALAARRTCSTCGQEKEYCIPISHGECNDCQARWDR
jgi:hypothetical protein